jgi:hypothetical protein
MPIEAHMLPKGARAQNPAQHLRGARDAARALAGTDAFEQSRRDRKRVEMLFAHLKRILKLARLRLRGPRGAQDEFTLAAIAQNLRRLAKRILITELNSQGTTVTLRRCRRGMSRRDADA